MNTATNKVFLDINTATEEELKALGIEDDVADAIVQHIERTGPIEDMSALKICGVNDDTTEVLKASCQIKLNLNTATVQQLQDVGIGMMLTIMIVDLRERKGYFVNKSQLDLKFTDKNEEETLWQKCEIGKFNINDANEGELNLLGVGQKVTMSIQDMLAENLINNIDELSIIKGLGKGKKLAALRSHCYLRRSEDEDVRDTSTQTVTRKQFVNLLNDEPADRLNIIHLNINSLSGKIDQLKKLIEDIGESLNVICLCETKLERETRKNDVDNFKFDFVTSRINPSRSGGVGMYVKSTTACQRKPDDLDFHIGNCENMWMELGTNGKIVVGTVYRHPGDDYVEFADLLADVIKKVEEEGRYYVILGDININLFDAHKHRLYIKLLNHLGCRSIINEVTRRESGTLIDHIYTNIPPQYIEAGIVKTYLSDHYTIYCSVDIENLPQNPATVALCAGQMAGLTL